MDQPAQSPFLLGLIGRICEEISDQRTNLRIQEENLRLRRANERFFDFDTALGSTIAEDAKQIEDTRRRVEQLDEQLDDHINSWWNIEGCEILSSLPGFGLGTEGEEAVLRAGEVVQPQAEMKTTRLPSVQRDEGQGMYETSSHGPWGMQWQRLGEQATVKPGVVEHDPARNIAWWLQEADPGGLLCAMDRSHVEQAANTVKLFRLGRAGVDNFSDVWREADRQREAVGESFSAEQTRAVTFNSDGYRVEGVSRMDNGSTCGAQAEVVQQPTMPKLYHWKCGHGGKSRQTKC